MDKAIGRVLHDGGCVRIVFGDLDGRGFIAGGNEEVGEHGLSLLDERVDLCEQARQRVVVESAAPIGEPLRSDLGAFFSGDVLAELFHLHDRA